MPSSTASSNLQPGAFAATDEKLERSFNPLAQTPLSALDQGPELLPFPNWDRYKILSCLGSGGMGSVYRAEDQRLKRTVAIKFLRSSQLDSLDPRQRRRFMREARAQARIEHPNICKISSGCRNSDGIA